MIRSAAFSLCSHRAGRPTADALCGVGGGGSTASHRTTMLLSRLRLRQQQQMRQKRTGAHGGGGGGGGGGRKKGGGGGGGGGGTGGGGGQPLSARDRAMGAADRARADRGAAPASQKRGNRRSRRGGDAVEARSRRDVAGIWRGYNAATSSGVASAVDYSVPPPIVRSPPPPPPRAGPRKYLFPATLLAIGGLTAYVYVNNRNDAYEYWNAMQSGEAPPPDAFDEDEEDEEFDYDDDEE